MKNRKRYLWIGLGVLVVFGLIQTLLLFGKDMKDLKGVRTEIAQRFELDINSVGVGVERNDEHEFHIIVKVVNRTELEFHAFYLESLADNINIFLNEGQYKKATKEVVFSNKKQTKEMVFNYP